ncbi:MAG TPA: HAMP domain-containing sensor histidine kinase [Candidatus Limnocylindria bacterium]|nr:HAMP domain-containing sensor histidine kinase [Candidatus Limnocylindria bacterium]
MSGIGARIALSALAAAALAIAIVAVGVRVAGGTAFERLMVEHGATVATAREMFEQTVGGALTAAIAAAGIASLAVAAILGRWLVAPLLEIRAAAARLAEGDLRVRVPAEGPREIASLAGSFNQMAERLEEHERERMNFVANAAHELRTPLTNLQGYLEALRDGVVEPSRESFASLHEEVDRLVRLARSLDDLARGDVDRTPPRLVPLDLYGAVAASVELVSPAFERRGIALEVRVPATLRARADPDHLAQVLANLLQNTVRYTPQGGRVTITADRGDGEVRVAVSNTGDGIPSPELERVFERFYRVEKSRDRSRGGAGIGLAIVKQLVERGGGNVGADSADGVTRFWFSLPV